jgi:hypothetical protein
MICPGKMRFGLVICGFAVVRADRLTPTRVAMALRVSPVWTTYSAACLPLSGLRTK